MANQMPSMAGPEGSASLEGRVVAMPDAYLPKSAKGLSLKMVLFILGGIIVLALIVIAVILFSQSSQPAAPQQPAAPAATTETQPSTPTPSQPSTDQQTQPSDTSQTAQPTTDQQTSPSSDTSQTPILQSGDNQTAAVVIPNVVSGTVATSTDTDQDGLTDDEEQVFVTSPSVPDTDGDGFLDGSEVVNLYDPATPGALLEVSPRVKTAQNEMKGYQMLIPSTWNAVKQTPDGSIYTITPPDGTEQFSITVYDNPDRVSVVQWFQQQVPGVDLNQYVNFKNAAGWSGISTRDKRLVIATYNAEGAGANALVFVFYYDVGQEQIMRFPSIWQMILNSLTTAPVASTTTTTTTNNATTTPPSP